MTTRPFSDRQAKYAAWRDRVKQASSDAKLDLTAEEEDDGGLSSQWSTESLFAESRAIAARDSRTD